MCRPLIRDALSSVVLAQVLQVSPALACPVSASPVRAVPAPAALVTAAPFRASGAAFLDCLRGSVYPSTKWEVRGIMHTLRRTAFY
jgi:hypothetical protein